MSTAVLDVAALGGMVDEGMLKAFASEGTPAKQREHISREIRANMTVQENSDLYFKLRSRNALPEHWVENSARRNRWEFCFKGEAWKGTKNGAIRRATEVVLDNTYMHICNEVVGNPRLMQKTPEQFMEWVSEASTTSNISPYVTNALPLVRRFVPTLLYTSLFTVFPVSQPDTKVFYLRRQYAETHVGGAASGTEVWPYNGDSHRDMYYSGGRTVGQEIGVGNGADVNFDLGFTPTYAHRVYVDGVEVLTGFTIGVGTGTGGVDRVQFSVAPAAAEVITATYDNQIEGSRGRDLGMTLDEDTIIGDTMKLRVNWTQEMEQNLKAYHNLSASAEFMTAMTEELYHDLDSIALNQALAEAAGGNANFDADGYLAGDTTSAARRAYDEQIYRSIIEASQMLYDTHRQWPVWIVAGTGAAQKLMELEKFSLAPGSKPGMATVQQRTELGLIANRWVLYQDPKLPADQMLLGWPSTSPFNMGYVLTTFIPFFATPVMDDSSGNFQKVQAVMYRGGRKMINADQYSTVTIQNL